MDAATKKTLISLITILKQLAEQNYAMIEFVLETSPESDALLQKLDDSRQSHLGLLRRLDEATQEVDRA